MVVATSDSEQSWALLVFFIFSIIKNYFVAFFYHVNNLFLHQSYLKSPLPVSQINLIRNAKNHFSLLKNFKNTESAHQTPIRSTNQAPNQAPN